MGTRKGIRRSIHLSRASAYWRLAAKAERASKLADADRYKALGDAAYALYQQEHERRLGRPR